MKKYYKILSVFCILIVVFSTFSISVGAIKDVKGDNVDIDARVHDGRNGDGKKGTSIGLAAWACCAYAEGWEYNFGGTSNAGSGAQYPCQFGHTWHTGHMVGATDCSGMIYLYRTASKNYTSMLSTAQNSGGKLPYGSLDSLPRIHGLCLTQSGHVGVYLGVNVTIVKPVGTYGKNTGATVKGNAIDERGDEGGYHVMLDSVYKGGWTNWCFADNLEYPKQGFVSLNDDIFYYEPTSGKKYSEYVLGKKTIDGVEYDFGDDGICKNKDKVPKDKIIMSAKATPQKSYLMSGDTGKAGDIKTAGGSIISGGSGGSDGSGGSGGSDGSTGDSSSTDGGTTYTGEDYSAYQSSRLTVDEYELTFDQERRIDEINKDRDRREDEAKWKWVYVILSLSGILVLIYTLLLIIVYYIDLFNSVTEVSLLHKLTFGRMYPVGSKDNIEHLRLESNDGLIYATHTTIWTTFVFGVLSSALLLNMRTVVILFLDLTNWFSSLISSWGS